MPDLAQRRARLLGAGMRQFYGSPFQPVRGEGVWLYDSRGKAYLDAYNNVPHVGHCNRDVVDALCRQAGTLNTNTRYLDDTILDYAERLTATLPQELSMCIFVCTGTEANDLAWRLACAHTGADGAIATRHAYHGNSTFVSALGAAAGSAHQQRDWVATVPAPTPQECTATDVDASGTAYAAHLTAAIDALEAKAHRLSAFYFDTLFASDGLTVPPAGFLAPAVERVHRAGGLCVADEVQPGLGRTGTAFWGFQNQGITPDIVTMGKPIGNGHPLAAVVTRPEIVDGFFERHRYFNTFGGNTVSCAVGLAVLDVLQRGRLQQNADAVGGYLKRHLNQLAGRHEAIGSVRGIGLFAGVEIVEPGTGTPAPQAARDIINGLHQRGVLVGLTGPDQNILKIRPPMIFDDANVDRLVVELDGVLGTDDISRVLADTD